jgi:hypothetical protein
MPLSDISVKHRGGLRGGGQLASNEKVRSALCGVWRIECGYIPVVYKITYQNDKTYIGCDMTDNTRYFGSANAKLIEQDFTPEERRNFTARKEILWESQMASLSELLRKEPEYILEFHSNDPAVGYNRSPRFKT